MKQVGVILLLILSLAATGCSRTKAVPQDEVHMNGAAFLQLTATVKAGSPVKFIDEQGAAQHILLVGTDGLFKDTPGAPTELNTSKGLTILPGQTIQVVFPSAGTFQVTCTIHPGMLLNVTVTP